MLQDACVRFYMLVIFGTLVGGPISLTLLLFTKYYWFTLFYSGWWFYEVNICNRGGRKSRPFRNLFLFKQIRDFYSIKLIKTSEIRPDKNYIFGSHPHGLHPFGTVINFATEANDFAKIFPGLTPYLTVWKYSFLVPVWREILNFTGSCSVSEHSIKYLLNMSDRGQVVVILVGGMKETNLTIPGKYRFVLKNRKGFARIALETGTSLVPVINFGENETLKYSFKFLYRKNVTTVVGKPIDVEKIKNPTTEEVAKLHEIYVRELTKLFEEHKAKYLEDPNTILEII